ncbi:MAG: DNA mismatch repair endonuclease MutL [Rikenellaceae bacterium]|jgi:DNA mismatch repair protein MutL|nr:DNA mismatch repair endonuclease MutL [Rikenellaceae bacterium]
MPGAIKLLPDSVANQIAAGEVVQRPASVVKELLENAVDAGAGSIVVRVREGGRDLIQVVDTGCGIAPGDIPLVFERHATSKISQATDLYALNSFGFRGEALASIASVSEVEMKTRRADDEVGTRVTIAGGKQFETTPVSAPCGTQFSIKNLFYNVPARRKFLKSNSTENRQIIDEFQRVALCHPEVEMKLFVNDVLQYNLPRGNFRQRIVGIMGKPVNARLLDLAVDTSIVRIDGFVGDPQSAGKNAKNFFFVNGRYFRSPYFHKAVVSACEKLVAPDAQPVYFLNLTVDPGRIDVNIHPSKTEIKFEDEQAVWQILNAAVRESLGRVVAVPVIDFENDSPIEIPVLTSKWEYKAPESSLNPDFNPFETPRLSGSGGGRKSILQTGAFGEEQAAGWEELYKHDYDSFDKTSTSGETFRNFIASEGDDEEQEFISRGFSSESEPFQEIDSLYEKEASQPEIDFGGVSAPFLSWIRVTPRHVALAHGESLWLVDIRRAYRRILYDGFLGQATDIPAANQQSMFPDSVEVSPEERSLLLEQQAELLKMGFDLRFEGVSAVALYGVPAGLENASPTRLVSDLLHEIGEQGYLSGSVSRERLAAAMARGALHARTKNFLAEEIENILSLLLDSPEAAYTHDGKPIVSVLSPEEIHKRLK